MKISNKGFTLIELMIVISIITILATMALPSYQDRVIRAQVKEGIHMIKFVKKDIADYYRAKGVFPANNAEAGLPEPEKIIGNHVKKVMVENGVIRIVYGNNVNTNLLDKTLTIRPAIVTGAPKVPVAWVNAFARVPTGMTVTGNNNTSILPRHLPISSRK